MCENSTANMDALLTDLEAGSLATQLVLLLRDSPKDQWAGVLQEWLRGRVAEEVRQARNAANQST